MGPLLDDKMVTDPPIPSLGGTNTYFIFLLFFNTKIMQVVEIPPQWRQTFILHDQYRGCWLLCEAKIQGISIHVIDLVACNIPVFAPHGLGIRHWWQIYTDWIICSSSVYEMTCLVDSGSLWKPVLPQHPSTPPPPPPPTPHPPTPTPTLNICDTIALVMTSL